jgi:Putative Ig domain
MLATFTPNAPDCQIAKFTPGGPFSKSTNTGVQFSFTPGTNHNPDSFSANFLPHGLSINASTGNISGVPTSPGVFNIGLTVTTNGCGTDTATLTLTVGGLETPDSTPWPVNRARKGTLAFADLTALPSTPTAITPTTSVGSMGNFLTSAQIDKLMGWRNYATTQQTGASFNTPVFAIASADNYARNFLGAAYPLATSFTTVSTAVQNNRTDQAAMNRQELIKLQRTINFPQSLLQYLGTFSLENNRPAQDWPLKSGNRLSARFDMTNLQIVIPGFRIRPGNNGKGHAWGLQKKTDLFRLFGLVWVDGNRSLNRLTNPDYYGHWQYGGPGHSHDINSLPADPDFFQIINYATNEAVGVNDPNRIQNTFNIGAALIDLYDGDDLYDPDPNYPGDGNTITIIDYGGASYAYGIEAMSYDNPSFNLQRPPLAPYPPGPPTGYVLLNRRFENVGEFGYAYNPASTLPSKTLDFASAASKDRAILDFFTYNEASPRAGIVNLNTRNGPVLASMIRGAWLRDQLAENPPPDQTYVVSQNDALAAGQAIVQATTAAGGAAVSRADIARLAAAAVAAVPNLAASDEAKQTIARALADTGQARTWNLMIDVIAQTGKYKPNAPDLMGSNFVVQGEKRYWLHVALDRDNGTVLGTQLEEVVE